MKNVKGSPKASDAPSDSQKADPQLPTLTKETWELIELRMWNSFKNRLWTLVAAILTVSALLGLLGVQTYVKTSVEKSMTDELQKMQEQRLNFDRFIGLETHGWVLILAMEDRIRADLDRHERQVERFKKEDPKTYDEVKNIDALSWLLERDPVVPDDPAPFFAEMKERRFQFRDISSMHTTLVHVHAIRLGIIAVKHRIYSEIGIDEDRLDSVYRSSLYNTYASAMKRLGGPSAFYSVDPYSINLLSGFVRKELPEAFDENPSEKKEYRKID